MNKKILNEKDLSNISQHTITQIANPVKRTLGPGGRPIVIQRKGTYPDGSPIGPMITKDGVTVAENIAFKDASMDTIAKAIIQVAQKTVSEGGDGTTTSIVLAEAIYKAGMKYVEQGENNIQLYEQLKDIAEEAIKMVDREYKKNIDTEDEIFNVAAISSNGDREIAQIVLDAILASGEDGYVAVEESNSRETYLEVVEGAVYKMGWRSFAANGSLQITDKAKNVAEYENAAICVYGGKLDDVHKMKEFINKVMEADDKQQLNNIFPLIFVALDFSDEVKQLLISLKQISKLPVAGVKISSDGSPNHKTQMLHDIAILTGGQVGARSILNFEDMTEEHLGGVDKVTIGPDDTVFLGGAGDKSEVLARIEELNTLLETAKLDPFDQENVQLRRGKLSGGLAIVRVGATSELEMKEKKDRIEDALCAAKVAVKDGIVPGAGHTLYDIAKGIPTENVAGKIMHYALQEPFRQIIRNIGEIPEVIEEQLTRYPQKRAGFNARIRQIVDLMEDGVIDPAIVTKSALRNAVSIAGLLLTAGGALVQDDSELTDGAPNPLASMFGGS